jgi:putative FmdB family regulatory protein
MPIYEYRCQRCGKQFEAFQGITEPEIKSCKFCKGKVQKLMSLSSFSLKGTGWYATDYKSKSPSGTIKKEKTDTSTPNKETSKSDSVPTASE